MQFSMAQFSFTNNTALLDMQNFHSGVAIGVVDVNKDGLDDIVRLQEGQTLYVEFQQINGSFTSQMIAPVSGSSEWTLCAGDVDNNGVVDFFTGGAYNEIKLLTSNTDGSSYALSNLEGDNLFAQGSNFVDINNDGWLDIFICHDDAESRIWANDGTGNFVSADDWIDMSKPGSDNSGNYGSVWTDFDNDGDVDLYIAKCRQGVNDSTDPRRINVLYVNDGNGNFTEEAEARGIAIGAQSWTADFADIDNDGDFDLFVTNHDTESQLFRNDNGYFTDISSGSGINVGSFPIQALMEDFDNDGYVDLLVAGSDEQIFHNNGDGTFSEIFGVFDNEDMESFGIGDLNHDGFLDIYAGYAEIFTEPSNVDDALWMNDGNDNNYIAIALQGEISNRDGIGAKIKLNGPWGTQIREVRAGESYGIVNSFVQHFGIGQHTSITSIEVFWPSGTVDVVDDPDINQFITILENNCVAPIAEITPDGAAPIVCPGSSLGLNAPAGFSYEWSTGATTQSITVNQGGTYGLTITDGEGCPGLSSIIVVENPDETPAVSVQGDLAFCEGGSVELTSTEANGYNWSTGATTQSITVSESGAYTVSIQGSCGNFTSSVVQVDVSPAPPIPNASGTTIDTPQSVTLMATGTGDVLKWYDQISGGNLLEIGNSYATPLLSSSSTYYVEDVNRTILQENAGLPQHEGGTDYSPSNYNGTINFNAISDFTIKSVKVYTDFPGTRIIELRDDSGEVLESLSVNIMGDEVVDLGFFVPQGSGYSLGTNEANNNEVFGNNSPELKRTDNGGGVDYPYTVPDVISMTGNYINNDYYYYFYDWKLEVVGEECASDRLPVEVVYQPTAITQLDKTDRLALYPNPTSGMLNLEMDFEEASDVVLTISDIAGRQVRNMEWNRIAGETIKTMNVSNLAKGFYTVKIKVNEENFISKLSIQ